VNVPCGSERLPDKSAFAESEPSFDNSLTNGARIAGDASSIVTCAASRGEIVPAN